jgi:hypothetical protein
MEVAMPRGDKSSYTGKQERMAEHIEEGHEKRGQSTGEAERKAWATVNKETHGGKKSGSGRGTKELSVPQGRKAWGLSVSETAGGGSLGLSEKGRANAQEARSIGVDHE